MFCDYPVFCAGEDNEDIPVTENVVYGIKGEENVTISIDTLAEAHVPKSKDIPIIVSECGAWDPWCVGI